MCPGWPVEAGFLRAAWPLGTPAWLRVELHTTAARSERQVDKMERTERWTRVELGRSWGGVAAVESEG